MFSKYYIVYATKKGQPEYKVTLLIEAKSPATAWEGALDGLGKEDFFITDIKRIK